MRSDRGAALLLAVVVDEHARRADVALLADVGVPDVRQVRDLGACADRRVLGFDERAELALSAEDGAGPQVGERADGRAVTDDGLPAMGADDRGVVADRDIGQRGVRADLAVVADAGAAEQLCAGVDDGVAADGHVDVDPRCGGVDDRHPCALVRGDDAPIEFTRPARPAAHGR